MELRGRQDLLDFVSFITSRLPAIASSSKAGGDESDEPKSAFSGKSSILRFADGHQQRLCQQNLVNPTDQNRIAFNQLRTEAGFGANDFTRLPKKVPPYIRE